MNHSSNALRLLASLAATGGGAAHAGGSAEPSPEFSVERVVDLQLRP